MILEEYTCPDCGGELKKRSYTIDIYGYYCRRCEKAFDRKDIEKKGTESDE